MKQTFTSARRPLEVLIHIISWGIMFGFPFFFVERGNGNINWMAYTRHLAVPLSFPESGQKICGLQYYLFMCHRCVASSLAKSDVRSVIRSQIKKTRDASGMVVFP